MSTHIVLVIAYEGTTYLGWQKTKEGPSIEEALESVLSRIFQQPISLRASSRTDRGVHAEHQVVDLFVHSEIRSFSQVCISINALLPPAIRCLRVLDAPYENFHPSLDVASKTYRYQVSLGAVQNPLVRRTQWHMYHELSEELVKKAAQQFIGTHDFRGFCNQRANLRVEAWERTIFSLPVTVSQALLTIEIQANNFLYKMARNIVGTMIWVGLGKLPLSSIQDVFQSGLRSRAGVTAPAHGLTLANVYFKAGPL